MITYCRCCKSKCGKSCGTSYDSLLVINASCCPSKSLCVSVCVCVGELLDNLWLIGELLKASIVLDFFPPVTFTLWVSFQLLHIAYTFYVEGDLTDTTLLHMVNRLVFTNIIYFNIFIKLNNNHSKQMDRTTRATSNFYCQQLNIWFYIAPAS